MSQLRKFSFNFATAISLSLLVCVSGCSINQASQSASETKSPKSLSKSQTASAVSPKTKLPAIKPSSPLTVAPKNPDDTTNAQVLQYVKSLGNSQLHGVWIESGDTLLANHQGTVPLRAASITKVATSLVALETFGPEHRFITQIGTNGEVKDGVLKGDLIVQGNEDPFFVWEEAINLGNTLNQVGIKQVTGNLVIVGKFYMNYKTSPQESGNLLKTAFNSKIWTKPVQNQFKTLPPGTPKPEVAIKGNVKVLSKPPAKFKPLVRHNSYPLAELLKKMNKYSNNYMADMLATSAGGAKVVAKKAAESAGVPVSEIQLFNGSGLHYENRISPRAATALFKAIENYLKPYNMTIADVFAVVGEDKGILSPRPLPNMAVVKSGSLDNTSALAGALPTQNKGIVWFAIMNDKGDLVNFRKQQENVLNGFVNQWGAVTTAPVELTVSPVRKDKTSNSEVVIR